MNLSYSQLRIKITMLSIAAAASYKRNRETNEYFSVNWLLLRTIMSDIDSIFMLYISELITFTEIKKCK